MNNKIKMKVLHVGAEFFPLIKTGGLADVLGSLPNAQCNENTEIKLLLPGYSILKTHLTELAKVATLTTFAGIIHLLHGKYQQTNIYLIDAPHLYERNENPYRDCYGNDYPDNYLRFALLSWMASEIALGLDPFWSPTIIHAHDWHAGLTGAYLVNKNSSTPSVFTIHNLAYQGCFAAQHLSEIQLPSSFFHLSGLEYYGQISFLKSGINYANKITTVSPTYAREITHPAYGFGLEGVLQEKYQQKKLTGILNGIDYSIWDPQHDPHLSFHYSINKLTNKKKNKQKLKQTLNLTQQNNKLLFCIISRFTYQKGLDILLNLIPDLIQSGAQLAILGQGDIELETRFCQIATQFPNDIALHIGYNESLSHNMIAGADAIIIPSRFEPCGLTQLYAMKYGTLPIVSHTGGLADTVIHYSETEENNQASTGFVFEHNDKDGLDHTLQSVFHVWKKEKEWKKIQINAMNQNYSWAKSAQHYLALYEDLL